MSFITITATIKAPITKVWECYTVPKHVTQWNQASSDWQCPKAVSDLKVGGKFVYTMEAKDGSFGFDFSGTYTRVDNLERIDYTLDDERQVEVKFEKLDAETIKITQRFEAEKQNSTDQQQQGWQSILNNFVRYVEKN